MVSLQVSRVERRLKGVDEGTSFHMITEIVCPSCDSKYVNRSNLDASKCVCHSCNHVWKVKG